MIAQWKKNNETNNESQNLISIDEKKKNLEKNPMIRIIFKIGNSGHKINFDMKTKWKKIIRTKLEDRINHETDKNSNSKNKDQNKISKVKLNKNQIMKIIN